jgi:predicted short-subunit dehydrogenase-like oxidoreductase (DUF2520 family)
VVVTAHIATARRAAKVIDSGSFGAVLTQLLDKNSEALRRLTASDLIIIATPDSAIPAVVEKLVALFENKPGAASRKSRTALHTSGAISSQVLNPLRPAGFAVGIVSSARFRSGCEIRPEIFRASHFCVEGIARAVRVCANACHQLGGRSFTIKPDSKPLYHAAAVMTSGHVRLVRSGAIDAVPVRLSARDAHACYWPLLRSTTTNLGEKDSTRALTGPYARGDFETARKH